MKKVHRGYVKGSYTLEAAIVFIFIFILLTAFIFFSLVLCQRVMLQGAAAKASKAVEINNITADVSSFVKYELERELKRTIISGGMLNISVNTENYVYGKIIKLEITQRIKVPFGFLTALINKNNSISIKAKSTAFIVDNAQNIRNADLLFEYAKKLKDGIKTEDAEQ